MKKSSELIKTFLVEKEQEALRLDQFLSQQDEIASRSQALKLLKQSRIFLNRKALTKASYRLKAGDSLSVRLLPEEAQNLKAYDYPLEILFEDESLMVLNKPSGLVTHPSPGHPHDSLVNALLGQNKKLSPGSQSLRPGIIHRLDKDSSGLLIVAKTLQAQEQLIEGFKNHRIQREYHALTLKVPQPLESRLETWLIRHAKHRQKFVSVSKFQEGAKKAITDYKLIKEHESGLSWIKCQLKTGRTHQIRVHLSSINCPILGDPLYGRQKLAKIQDPKLKLLIKNLNRVALHAFRLKFQHPLTKKNLKFEIPWPKNLSPLLNQLHFK